MQLIQQIYQAVSQIFIQSQHTYYIGYEQDFPEQQFRQFQEQFSTEEDCVSFLYDVKWPNGFVCPACSHDKAYTIQSRRLPLYQCCACKHQTSITAGTIMEKSRTSLRKWLTAIYFVSLQTCNPNATQLCKIIDVTYKTAWSISHKIRQAISTSDNELSLLGNIKSTLGFCNRYPKPSLEVLPSENPVFIAASYNQYGIPHQYKIKLIPTNYIRNGHVLSSAEGWFEQEHISDDFSDNTFIEEYRHRYTRPLKTVIKQVTNWIKYTYRSVSQHHLQTYLDEACYRINLTTQRKPIFENLTSLCMSVNR